MGAAKVACPKCKAVLKVAPGVSPGRKVNCPKCGISFEVVTANGNNASIQPAPEDSAFATLSPAARRPRRSRGRGLVVGLCVAGMLLLVGAAVGITVFLSSAKKKSSDQDKVADEDKARPPSPRDGNKPSDRGKPPKKEDFQVSLPKEKQRQVNDAIEAGKRFLKEHQGPDGRWDVNEEKNKRHQVGLAALPGLTLLECGEPASDPVIRKAAEFVRANSAKLRLTYDISLAILFMDKLNDSGDEKLIHKLALRLVAGQTGNGGWTYRCPLLAAEHENQLAAVLQDFPLTSKLELVEAPRVKKNDPNRKLNLEAPPAEEQNDKPDDTKLRLTTQETPQRKQKQIDALPPRLKRLPVMQVKAAANDEERLAERSDNSNTQFAVLALWAARRHHVPLDRTLALIVKRFRTSQFPTGGWGYGYTYTVGIKNRWVGRPAMACAGLLGLAVGHGLAQNINSAEPLSAKDTAVTRALQALGAGLARMRNRGARNAPDTENAKPLRYNLYLLWSVERVGMIYKLKKIGQVDWYSWGTDLLLDPRARAEDGSWQGSRYAGSTPTINTCLALLFLKRVNLARDLTEKLTLDLS